MNIYIFLILFVFDGTVAQFGFCLATNWILTPREYFKLDKLNDFPNIETEIIE
jgi:hypothetical protein